MLKKTFTTIMLIAGMLIGLPATSDDKITLPQSGAIISQTDAAEAEKIHLFTDKDNHIERIYVEGCSQCPLRLTTNKETSFSRYGIKIKDKEAKSYSLKPGTVIYNAEKKLALKVDW